MMIDIAYVRYRENLPESATTFAAADGFTMQGIPVVPYYGFGDLDEMHKNGRLTPNKLVAGYIGDVHKALDLLGKPIPPPLDYPEHLEGCYGRSITRGTLGDVRNGTEVRFVKPIKQKVFTGLVFDPADPIVRVKLATVADEEPCFISELIDFVSEWRCYMRDGRIVGIKHYKGDEAIGFNRGKLDAMVSRSHGKMPAGCSIDIGVTSAGDTCIVECNDGFSLGNYGLPSIIYARLIEARWVELMKGA